MPQHSTVDRALAAALATDTGTPGGKDLDSALDTAASLLAADSTSDAELARRGEEFVRRAWQYGWQPADVARAVRGRLGEDHLRIAARLIVSETRRYGTALPHRWPEQLRRLAAEEKAATAPAPSRFAQATTVLELYRLLTGLPRIEPAGPVPGQAPAVPVAGEPKTFARIRALLAKAEATPYPEEAEALSTKAQELMARHSVDEALLAARRPAADEPAVCRIGVDAPYETAKAVLLDAVATANGCRAVWNSSLGFTTVVGFESDLDAVELLYTSLLVQAHSAMSRSEGEARKAGRKRTRTFRQSFLAAYAQHIGDRLRAVAHEVAAEQSSLLPVLAGREVAVTDRMEQMFPETVTTRVRGVTDAAGWHRGTEAADRAALRPGRAEVSGGTGRPAR
ncbi:DUF2786 domain-containing protein [Streptomyces sp. N2-109]|uniref:DUF2786 domain-containing protein n=1 Tax=Streptomyces gossypii TaxID=2883101 RepID=A0ABT2JV94_9ACTN|nr:DUF2786 domain-containing protein [Streptomyces gossypii]MCT2591588.1 DUF2786 domain-containing protein [Streptomyces gossypii]